MNAPTTTREPTAAEIAESAAQIKLFKDEIKDLRKKHPTISPDAILACMLATVFDAVKSLAERIQKLEAEPTLRFMGTWSENARRDPSEKIYSFGAGACVTHQGSLWVAKRATAAEPGAGSTDWQLAVKRGRDGKDRR